MKKKRVKKTPSLNRTLYDRLRCLALDEGKGFNDLLEEGMESVLRAFQRPNPPRAVRSGSGSKREKFSTTLDPTLYVALRKLALKQRVRTNDLIEDGIRRVLRRRKDRR